MDPNFNDSDPSKVHWITWLWVWGLIMLGSFTAHIEKVRTGRVTGNRFLNFLASVFTSALVGMSTFFVCEAFHVDKMLSAAIIGVASSQADKMLRIARDYVTRKAKAI